jgi:VWFA-related protein
VREKQSHSATLPLALAMLLFSTCLAAQTATGPQQPSQPNAPGSAYNLNMQVPLVLEDLVVRDRNGNPVKGLKSSDFTVTENAKPVTLRNFEEHTPALQSGASLALPNLGPNTFTNLIAAPTDSLLNIMLLDVLNTPMADQEFVRQQMLNYLGTLAPGVPIAIFQLDTQLHLLQGFTADPGLLRAAIDKGRNIVRAPRMTDTKSVSDYDPMIYHNLSEIVRGESAQSISDIQRVEAERRATEGEQRAILTQQALIQLGRYLSGLSGRKSLIWFSASFPVSALPNILVRNRVALYLVDARGHMTPPPCLGQGCAAQLSAFEHAQLDQHAAMAQLARSTGGEAFDDTNGLKEAIEKAISDDNNYYTFTYTPPEGKFDGSFRKIEVKCKRSGLRLSYRAGYVAIDPNTLARNADSPAPSALQDSLRLGAPAATQILFAVKLNPQGASADKVSTGAKPNATLMKPPYRRYELDYRVDISNALFTISPDGVRHGSLDFAVFVYTPEGVLANQTVNKINLDLTAARYVEMIQRGLKIGQIVETPVRGNYFLRVLVYDPNGDRVGATEIPLADLQSKQTVPDNAPNRAQLVMPK